MQDKLIRIGVFYDGNYFFKVSNFYNYDHSRKRRISVSGLHNFIRNEVANHEGSDARFCHIVDAHYFRGRLSAHEAQERGNVLFSDRVFDDILMSEGVTTHYLPLKNIGGQKMEKGIDVWLALEAYELAFYKRFNVLVLVAGDGDYVPLIRKLNTLGTRVMLLSWDFESITNSGDKISTRTSQDLLEEATYPIAMHELIDNRVKSKEPTINNLFVSQESPRVQTFSGSQGIYKYKQGEILTLKNGFGFIKLPPNNLFFHYSSLKNVDFNDLKEGDLIEYKIGKNEKGEDIATEVRPYKV